jgi:hypothetical protein
LERLPSRLLLVLRLRLWLRILRLVLRLVLRLLLLVLRLLLLVLWLLLLVLRLLLRLLLVLLRLVPRLLRLLGRLRLRVLLRRVLCLFHRIAADVSAGARYEVPPCASILPYGGAPGMSPKKKPQPHARGLTVSRRGAQPRARMR